MMVRGSFRDYVNVPKSGLRSGIMCNKKLWDTTIKVNNWSDIHNSMETQFFKSKHEYQEIDGNSGNKYRFGNLTPS
jgi:hypothetical protein